MLPRCVQHERTGFSLGCSPKLNQTECHSTWTTSPLSRSGLTVPSVFNHPDPKMGLLYCTFEVMFVPSIMYRIGSKRALARDDKLRMCGA
eukprot:scaffold1798_cov376-Prasinococcus_capsulatus_cf.AAC.7